MGMDENAAGDPALFRILARSAPITVTPPNALRNNMRQTAFLGPHCGPKRYAFYL
jgi:hypothetical protein